MKQVYFTVRLDFDEDVTDIKQFQEISKTLNGGIKFYVNNIDSLCPTSNLILKKSQVWHCLNQKAEKKFREHPVWDELFFITSAVLTEAYEKGDTSLHLLEEMNGTSGLSEKATELVIEFLQQAPDDFLDDNYNDLLTNFLLTKVKYK